MPDAHAKLAASSAAKWMHCAMSAYHEMQYPDTSTKYTEAGTLAHSICESKMRHYLAQKGDKRKHTNALKKLRGDPLYATSMEGDTDQYVDHIKALAISYTTPSYIAIEQRVAYGAYVPEGFGTCDCVLINGGHLHIVDYKNGHTPVRAESNPQLRLYALGAYLRYAPLYGTAVDLHGLHTAYMTIVQPNGTGISTEELPITELLQWAKDEVKPAAALAIAARESGQASYAPGHWCEDHFCAARSTCRARAEHLAATLSDVPMQDPARPKDTLSPQEIADLLPKVRFAVNWLKDIEAHAHKELCAGRTIPGYKLVDGGRHDRFFTNQEDAFAHLQYTLGYDEALLYTRQPLPLTGVEGLLGKKKFAETMAAHVSRKPGRPTLAPETDKRPTWQETTAQNDFADLITNTQP
jgi:RecB family exonuclease